jgi:hypothetical protein
MDEKSDLSTYGIVKLPIVSLMSLGSTPEMKIHPGTKTIKDSSSGGTDGSSMAEPQNRSGPFAE